MHLDPVTLAVIQNGLNQVCNEMDLAFCRAAFSPVISEAQDRSDGIYHRDDGALIAVASGRYAPNPWGLQDMHGNVAEWTRSGYAPYPWAADGRDDESRVGRKVVRGGSWRDMPTRGSASFRLSYESWQHIYNVGFRIVCEGELKDGSIPVSTISRGATPKISAR